MNDGWISVKERLPKDDSDVLWFVLDDWEGNTNFVAVGPKSIYADNLEQVSHWMPLPLPPFQANMKCNRCSELRGAHAYITAECPNGGGTFLPAPPRSEQ